MVMRPSGEPSNAQRQSSQAPYPITPPSVQPPVSYPVQPSNGLPSDLNARNPEIGDTQDDDAQPDSGSDWDEISDDEVQETKSQAQLKTNAQGEITKLPIHPKPSEDTIPDRLRIGKPISSPVEPNSANANSLHMLGLPGVPSSADNSSMSPQHKRLNSNPYIRKREEEIQRRASNAGGLSPNQTSIWDGGDLYEIPNTPFTGHVQPSAQPLASQVSNQSASGQMVNPSPGDDTHFQPRSPSDNAPELVVFPGNIDSSSVKKDSPLASPFKNSNISVTRPNMGQSSLPAPIKSPELSSLSPTHHPIASAGNKSPSIPIAVSQVDGQHSPSRPTVDMVPPIVIPSTNPNLSKPEVETPRARAKRERNEFYYIKLVRWHDASSEENPRTSPILIQNANGPCPLLALVNALVLSTPAKTKTALVETLRTREQVSLGLLLDAVFDELTSGRRGGATQDLPDVSDLYSFLITLHTGMNVNPRFIPPRTDGPSLLDLDEYDDPQVVPGGFEQTREMRLYSTFSLPLIHGWMPIPKTETYAAFSRRAQTYEDAQNIQFQEEDLEVKLNSQGLSSEEQGLYMDLGSIKAFLSAWPTQLTTHGLDTLNKALAPASFSILFRNDHFSTIYKEPVSGHLMTLVTDAGYATHDEIVWESLVDINGTNSEMYAGDFKSVSHNYNAALYDQPDTNTNTDANPFDDTWTTVQPRNRRNPASTSTTNPSPPNPGTTTTTTDTPTVRNTEQEDHDLALALQLQEEEEEASRRAATARRRHEDELSHRFLSSESARRGPEDLRPAIPVRRTGSLAATTANASSGAGTTFAPPPGPAPGGDLPTYEQAARGPAFVPPRGHPASEHAPTAPTAPPAPAAPGYRYEAPGQGIRPARRSTAETGRRMSARQSLAEQLPAAARGRAAQGYGLGHSGGYNASGGGGRRRTVESYGGDGGGEDREKCLVM